MVEIRENNGKGYGQTCVCTWCMLARLWAHMCGHLIMCVHMIVETQSHLRPFPLLLIEARSLSQSLSSLVWWFVFDTLFLRPWADTTSTYHFMWVLEFWISILILTGQVLLTSDPFPPAHGILSKRPVLI